MIPTYGQALPAGWEEKRLRDATVRRRGYSWSKEVEVAEPEESAVPVLRIPNVQDTLDLSNLLYLRNVSPEALHESGVTKDWILFVASNGNPDRIGDSALITVDKPMVFASFLMGIASKCPDVLTPEFLSYWLRLHSVHEAFSKTSQQTTGLANFSWSAVKKLPIRYPSALDEQKAITQVLDAVTKLVASSGEKLRSARGVRHAFMQQLFTCGLPGLHSRFKQTKIGEIPEGWDVIPLGSLASIVSGFALNSDREPRFHPHRYLTVINVQRESLELSEVRHMEVYPHEIPDALLREDDIVLVEGHANPSEIGRAALITETASGFAFQNHLFRIRRLPGSEAVPLFLLGVLNSERVRRHWGATCNTSSGLNTINRRGVRRLLIQWPRPDEQKEIAKLLSAANVAINACSAELTSAQQLKRSLLYNMLTGVVRVRV